MNVYQKLNAARLEFHSLELKKSGHNKFAGYKYFELGDFLIPALKVFEKHGLCATISFLPECAKMCIVNVDKIEEYIPFESPMVESPMKGATPIQCIGAVETYQRRYLWMIALEIVEHDAINSSEPLKEEERNQEPAKIGGMFRPDLDDIAAYLVEQHEAGMDLEAIRVWYSADTFSKDSGDQNDEKMYVWNVLKPYSKLRSAIKANKPEEAKA